MLRLETETGFFLITHPDHAHLAALFAGHWGNDQFTPPHPRTSVLHGIRVHDDGWAARDASPSITRQGRPSAFSTELVGAYSAFEEIDLADYLAVREQAVGLVEAIDPYAALLVSMHTYNLLTERADRGTIAPTQLPLLDAFLDRQRARQVRLLETVRSDPEYTAEDTADKAVLNNFRLLQATDNLSLLSCIAHRRAATCLHPLPTQDGGESRIAIVPTGEREFRLAPWPFDQPEIKTCVQARHVEGHLFASAKELSEKYHAAPVVELDVRLTS
jgi:hypothetical protein